MCACVCVSPSFSALMTPLPAASFGPRVRCLVLHSSIPAKALAHPKQASPLSPPTHPWASPALQALQHLLGTTSWDRVWALEVLLADGGPRPGRV